jgi:hypothetical protein
MTERIEKQARKKTTETPESKADNDNAEAAMSEWMQIMLEEMERKRDEQEEAREELELRTEDAPKSASRPRSGRRTGGTA